jgi:hypothetical protein
VSAGGGTVFTAATTDWPKLLSRDASVDQITRNVVDRLQTCPIFPLGRDTLTTLSGAAGVAGYYAAGDGYQHVIVATSAGELYEVYWQPGSTGGVGQNLLATVDDAIVSVAGYYAGSDGLQHVVVATQRGPLLVFAFLGGGQPVKRRLLARLRDAVAIAGYYSDSDGYQHVIVANSTDGIDELFFKP